MSKHETWRTRKYWKSIGGLLIEEFQAIPGNKNTDTGKRLIDGIIVVGAENKIQTGGSYNFEGKEIIVVQTKANRLGMYLMGQALFSREIMKRFKPKSIKAVAICGKGDSEMEPICREYGIEIVVINENEQPAL